MVPELDAEKFLAWIGSLAGQTTISGDQVTKQSQKMSTNLEIVSKALGPTLHKWCQKNQEMDDLRSL